MKNDFTRRQFIQTLALGAPAVASSALVDYESLGAARVHGAQH